MGTWGKPQMPDEYVRYLREAKTIKRKEDERSTDDTYAAAAFLYAMHSHSNAAAQAIAANGYADAVRQSDTASEDSSSSEMSSSSSTSDSGSID